MKKQAEKTGKVPSIEPTEIEVNNIEETAAATENSEIETSENSELAEIENSEETDTEKSEETEIENSEENTSENSEEPETRRTDEPAEETEKVPAATTPNEPKKNGVPTEISNLLVNKIYRLKKEIEEKERKLEQNRKTLIKWQDEDDEKLKTLNEKYESDKVNKIIEYRETGCLQGKIVLIEYYQKQIVKLLIEKEEQETTGKHGDFSDLYKEYVKARNERYEKNMASLKKNYLDSTLEKREISIPKIVSSILTLKEELQAAEQEAEKYQKV